jgi:protein SCO1/2
MRRSPLYLLAAAVACGGCACAGNRGDRAAQDLRGYVLDQPLAKPGFTLTATDGKPFDFRPATDGFLTLVFFGYTNCPDICPVHMSNLGAVLPELDPQVAARIKVVFVTTDPRRDTPAVIRTWLDHFSRGFIGLTGDSTVIAGAQTALQLPPAVVEQATAADTGYTVGHSALVIAFTPDNRAHVVYPYGTRQEDWAHDLPKLAQGRWGGGAK